MKIKNIKEKVLTTTAIVAIVAAMYFLKISCIFKLIFKIPCPGCGMTRAYISLLHFDFAKAFEYNFMFWSVPILFLLYLFDGKLFKKKWINSALSGVIVFGFIVGWILKLI